MDGASYCCIHIRNGLRICLGGKETTNVCRRGGIALPLRFEGDVRNSTRSVGHGKPAKVYRYNNSHSLDRNRILRSLL